MLRGLYSQLWFLRRFGEGLVDCRAQAFAGIFGQYYSIDEKRGRGFDSIAFAFLEVVTHDGFILRGIKVRVKLFAIETHLGRVFLERVTIERRLILK